MCNNVIIENLSGNEHRAASLSRGQLNKFDCKMTDNGSVKIHSTQIEMPINLWIRKKY